MRWMILFDCKHVGYFSVSPPKVGDILWCQKCRKEVRAESAPEEWKIRCMKCVYSRAFGLSKDAAVIAVGRHRRKYPEHSVKLFNGNRLDKVFQNRYQTVIPLGS